MDQLSFSVDSALLSELGEKLVETVHLALAELVKNCYDADATLVEIVFTKDNSGKVQIIISDNGTGMNFEAIQSYWMRIATSNKSKQRVSKVFGRSLSGAKGIGRFSCRRLGNHLKIVTNGTKEGNLLGTQPTIENTVVDFPWNNFVAGEDITSIKCPGSQKVIQNVQTGTKLIITDVPDEWTEQGYNWLKRQLAVLAANRGIKREGFIEDPGFNVHILADDYHGEVEDIRANLIQAGWGTLTARINNRHQAECELNALGIGKRTITSNLFFENLDDVCLEVAIMVDDRSQIRNLKILNLGTMERILNDWGGVQIKYRGFRVYPYGDDDWLEIDRDRGLRRGNPGMELFEFAQSLNNVDPGRSLLNMLSMRSYVGSVYIGEKAKGFELKLNREGFLASPEFEQLKSFVRFAIDWSTILRDFYLREEEFKKVLKVKDEFERLIEQKIENSRVVETALDRLNTEADNLSRFLPTEQKDDFKNIFTSATEVIRSQHNSSKRELMHLRLVASTSTLLLIFSHEVKSLLGFLEQSKNSLESLSKKTKNINSDVNEIIRGFVDLKDRLFELLNLTSLVGRDNRIMKPGQVAVLEKVRKVKRVFELIVNKYDIKIDYSSIPPNMVFRNILEAEVYSILLNVLSNSIKAVIAGGRKRNIQISAERKNDYNYITIRDTGIGLSPDRFKEVFIPFISDPDGNLYENLDQRINPEDNLIVGSGSGLGLGIVKEIITARLGDIYFKEPEDGWSSELIIKLP